MKMDLFGFGQQGRSSKVDAQSRVNCFIEVQQDKNRTQTAIYGTPGLTLIEKVSQYPTRGMYSVGTVVFIVQGPYLLSVDTLHLPVSGGIPPTLFPTFSSATLSDVTITDNSKYLMVTDGVYGYYVLTATGAVTQINDPNFPASPISVTYQDGFFIVCLLNSNRFYVSDQGGTTWANLYWATMQSSPGVIRAVMSNQGTLWIFGDHGFEAWQNVGALDFPFARSSGFSVDYGLVAPFSLAKFSDSSIIGLFTSRLGEVRFLNVGNGGATDITGQDLAYQINRYAVLSDATAYAFSTDGHPMYQVTFPRQNVTWVYDGATNLWSEQRGYPTGRHPTLKAATVANVILASDYRDGSLYRIDAMQYANAADPQVLELTSRRIWDDDKWLIVSRLQIDFGSGVGLSDGQGSLPRVMLQVSKDGGVTWGSEMWRDLGATGCSNTRAIWRSLGRAREWNFRIRISDPVARIILGASVDIVVGGG